MGPIFGGGSSGRGDEIAESERRTDERARRGFWRVELTMERKKEDVRRRGPFESGAGDVTESCDEIPFLAPSIASSSTSWQEVWAANGSSVGFSETDVL